MDDHLKDCHKVADAVLKAGTDAKKEHDQGYEDGKEGRPCNATSLQYLKGYGRGRKIRVSLADLRRLDPQQM